ncbi:hypothetical protein G3495_14365 [Shewanella baltica]|nr:hypothetical protein Sbal175_3827 [Shewanella baltica BA175]AEH12313.1 hypothetical protein Sbal117_0517 [Shewanella baltica OS117]EHQ13405.1 hypothetical protein Sbal183_0467 [Shewanella baltica OS183]MCS6162189.1 hypothetical protein [Shewanella baltica]MCS6236297.1 hypothetical protein [Shewanella baltica]
MQHISFANSIKHRLALVVAKVDTFMQLNQFYTFDLKVKITKRTIINFTFYQDNSHNQHVNIEHLNCY